MKAFSVSDKYVTIVFTVKTTCKLSLRLHLMISTIHSHFHNYAFCTSK